MVDGQNPLGTFSRKCKKSPTDKIPYMPISHTDIIPYFKLFIGNLREWKKEKLIYIFIFAIKKCWTNTTMHMNSLGRGQGISWSEAGSFGTCFRFTRRTVRFKFSLSPQAALTWRGCCNIVSATTTLGLVCWLRMLDFNSALTFIAATSKWSAGCVWSFWDFTVVIYRKQVQYLNMFSTTTTDYI